jgi:hypothetical protein
MTVPDPESTLRDPEPQSFPEDCKQVLHGLRGALTAALGAVAVDPARPQEVARKLGLHRNLTWKVSKIVTSTNVFAAVPHVPGKGGVDILMNALIKAGAAQQLVDQIGVARADFDRLVREHSGDRATLDLVAAGYVADGSQRENLTNARRQAFRGNSATWSVQARALMSIRILAPSADDPDLVDMAQVFGLVDFRRLRPDVSWPLFIHQAWTGEGCVYPKPGKPLDPDCDPNGVPLLRKFCSAGLPEIRVNSSEGELEYELPAGPVGRVGELSVLYGVVLPSVGPQRASETELVCELGTNIRTPVELLHTDLLVHEDLRWAMEPRAEMFSLLEGRSPFGGERRACTLLDGETDVHELGRGISTMATPHLPRYDEVLRFLFDSTGWDESRFRGFRHTVNYPPIPAVSMLSMDLEGA